MEIGNKSYRLLIGIISVTIIVLFCMLQNQLTLCNDQKNIILIEYHNKEILTNFTNSLNNSYKNEIYPTGKEIILKQIQSIKEQTKDDPNPVSKLDKIFIWEMKDWHNPDPVFPVF